jgi:hypothetical protein
MYCAQYLVQIDPYGELSHWREWGDAGGFQCQLSGLRTSSLVYAWRFFGSNDCGKPMYLLRCHRVLRTRRIGMRAPMLARQKTFGQTVDASWALSNDVCSISCAYVGTREVSFAYPLAFRVGSSVPQCWQFIAALRSPLHMSAPWNMPASLSLTLVRRLGTAPRTPC